MKSKIIALYLPQFHCIPENDEFWGKGFTDWVTVKKAKPLFDRHVQPRVPQNGEYYDLSRVKDVEYQASLAYEHGIYGFGVYHYWFNNEKNLLTKPAEILRDSKSTRIKYFFVWDNCLWKRSWSNIDAGNDWAPTADNMVDKKSGCEILIPYILGDKPDWENHYHYVSKHFHSKNYEKRNGKPVFCIINYSTKIAEMCEYWDRLAKTDGFDGMCFIYKYIPFKSIPSNAFAYNYEPHWSGWERIPFIKRAYRKVLRLMKINYKKPITYIDYDKTWQKLISYAASHPEPNLFHGGFVDYDDSPRRGMMNSIIMKGASPEKFKRYFNELYNISSEQHKDYIFFTAWNEWGEGAYLEPDTHFGTAYLEAIKNIVNSSEKCLL